jgi:hypothetical protein
MIAREHGFRAVSVDQAVCVVPRTGSLQREYKRKVRTVCGGIQTLWYMRRLLNPFRYPLFAWMLFSHKLCRWLIPLSAAFAVSGLAFIALSEPWAGAVLLSTALVGILAVVGWRWPAERPMPRLVAFPAFLLLAGNLSVLHAWVRAFFGQSNTTWEPTRREAVTVR